MTRKLLKWFVKEVLIAAAPLLIELIVRRAAVQSVFTSEKNIPELMFLSAMVNLGTASNIEKASEVLDETKTPEKELKESLSIWHNLMVAGMVIASALFGVYVAVDTLGTSNKAFLPNFAFISWGLTALLFFFSLSAQVFINIRRKP